MLRINIYIILYPQGSENIAEKGDAKYVKHLEEFYERPASGYNMAVRHRT